MTPEPRGVYRTQGENGKPNTALLESGTLGFEITERDYRANRYKPDFDDLPWSRERRAIKKDDHRATEIDGRK